MAASATDIAYPSYDRPEDLARDLKAQKFAVETDSTGNFVVTGSNGTKVRIHRTPSDNRWFANRLQELKAMGFVPPSIAKNMKECAECGERFYGVGRLTKHKIEVHGLTFECKVCKETGFTSPGALAVHMRKNHPDQTKTAKAQAKKEQAEESARDDAAETLLKDAETRDEIPKAKPGRKAGPVRTRYEGKLGEIMTALDELEAAGKVIRDNVKHLYKENQELRRESAEIERRVEGMIGALRRK